MTKRTIKGLINITASGHGYVSSTEIEDDIKIDSRFLNTALDGDEVEIILHPMKPKERIQGEVIKVLKRKRTRFVGTVDKKKNQKFAFLLPDDERFYVDIFISSTDVNNGDKALVELTNWSDPKKSPEGRVIKVIGKKGENQAELYSIVMEKGLPIDFPEKIKKEAQKASKKKFNTSKRRDFRGIPTFTIDPEDAKDFDDALSIKNLGDGNYEVGVHIADVSYYIEENTELDKQARERAFSIYLVDRTIPMLPEILSNNICSLMPNKDRLAMSAVFTINRSGKIKDRWFGETIIRSSHRFTYKEAQNVLDKKQGKFFKELSFLSDITKIFQKQRIDRGALNFDDDELQFSLDNDGRPLVVYIKEKLFTHKLVEELMVLANKEVANKFGTLFRIHEPPEKDSINSLISFLSKIGYRLEGSNGEITSKELNTLFKKIEGEKEEFLVKSVVLQSMTKAVYSEKNKKHFGLALNNYTHFTSPIRRYADLLVHRIVKKKIAKEPVNPKNYSKVAKEISLVELDVLSAERDSVSYKKVQFMIDKIGETFEAVISGVTRFGVFIRTVEAHAEGLVSIRDMDDDYYVLDEETYSLIGTKKNKRYSLGDVVKVKLVNGSTETRRLDFVFKS